MPLEIPGRSATIPVMENRIRFHNCVVAAFLALMLAAAPALAVDQAKVDGLLDRLTAAADAAEAGRIEAEILIEWSKSGSPAIDLLMQRGEDALAMGDALAAAEHFTAVIDHDPAFTEGWAARASAYYTAGEVGPALADIAHVLADEPRHFAALSGLGVIMEESGDDKRALSAYLAARAVHPYIQPVNEAIDRLEKKLEGQEL